MTQLTLFDSEPEVRQVKRERHQFDLYEHAARFAKEANCSGKFSDVFIVTQFDRPVVITEREE